MANVTYMPAVSPQAILDCIERFCDTTGWVRKEVEIRDPHHAVVTVSFKDSDPRQWHVVSDDMFASIDNVKIYEVDLKVKPCPA